MKRYLFRMAVSTLLTFTAFMLPSCDTKDDELWERVDELFGRVEKLEDTCKQMNTDIHSIQSVLSAIQNNYSITSVKPLENEEGYQISFSNGSEITIHHGKDGENGSDGKDGDTPTISIKDMGNGRYAWLVNGEILCDAQGSPISVNGQDGKDGEDGEDGYNGSSAPTPMVKTGSELISSGFDGSWDREAVYISVNRGISWTKISAGNGSSIFSSVDTSKAGVITFTLNNGIKFTVPRTDDLASLIIGEWFFCDGSDGSYPNFIYQFNADGTYFKRNPEGSNNQIGTYELEGENYILFEPNAAWDFMTIISFDEYLMIWGTRGYIYYLYRPNAFVFEETVINAPQEGGTFTIQVNTKFPFKVSDDKSNHIDNSNTNNIYVSTNSTLSYEASATENSIEIKIAPNMSNLNLITSFGVEDRYGNEIATITINQEKNTEVSLGEVKLSEWGKNVVGSLYSSVGGVTSGLTFAGWDYSSGNTDFKPKLSPDNIYLSNDWSNTYRTINDINKILKQSEQELSNGPLKAPLETLRAIIYYYLAICWGNINYVTEVNLNNINSVQQLTTAQLFDKLIPQLKNAIEVLEERRNPIDTDDYFLSKDVARMALAEIYMYQGEYEKAEALLQKIQDNNYYDYSNNDESILFRGYPIYQYTDLLLGLAECKFYSDSPNDADIFINEILNYYHRLNIESTDKKQIIKEIYMKLMTNYHQYSGYFAFLKRNGLAKETIGITDDNLLLFPIPQSELDLNPNMVQNPGY